MYTEDLLVKTVRGYERNLKLCKSLNVNFDFRIYVMKICRCLKMFHLKSRRKRPKKRDFI